MGNHFFQYERLSEDPKARLFCFHYAGGSAFSYIPWEKSISEEIDILPFQLAGRGSRKNDPFDISVEAAANQAAAAISKYKDKEILLVGHSMGGSLAFMVAYILKTKYDIKVKKLFISASLPSLVYKLYNDYHYCDNISDDRFIDVLLEFGAIDRKLAEMPEFTRQFMPVIRNDFRLIAGFDPVYNSKINTDIIVYCGDSDKVADRTDCEKWREFTTGIVDIKTYPGGHFFINDYFREICQDINSSVL